ncbi:MAG TPA: MBL fold metallo-hydrolase, partial [Alphaproteobacteria bacterium]
DHFDGTHFSAPEPLPSISFLSVLKWRMTSKRKSWTNWVDYQHGPTPVPEIEGKELKATFINHSTFLLQTEGLNILTDPIWSERASPFSFMGPKRVHAPGIAFDQLPQIDAVVISHSHYDHLDIPTVKKLVAKDNPLFIVPLGVDTIIRKHVPSANIKAIDWGSRVTLVNSVSVTAEPVLHWSARSLGDRNETLWAAYAITTPNGNIYFSGDTGYGSGKVFKETGKKYGGFRLALIAIGAYEPRWFMRPSHINPSESVKIFQDLNAAQAIGMHFGTFQLTDEGMDEPVNDLKTALAAAPVSPEKFHVLKPGESLDIK